METTKKVNQMTLNKLMSMKFKWDKSSNNNKGFLKLGEYYVTYRRRNGWYIIVEDSTWERILECTPNQDYFWSLNEEKWNKFAKEFLGEK